MAFFNLVDNFSDTDLRVQLNIIVSRSITSVSFWAGILYAFFSVSHLFFLPQETTSIVMSLLTGSTALILFSISMAARHWSILPAQAHPVAVAVVVLAILNTLVHILLTHDIQQTTNLMLIFVGAAFFILSTQWFMTVVMAGMIGWSFVLIQLPNPEGKIYFAFGIVISVILSTIIHYVHIQATKKFVLAQINENRYRVELTALNSIITSITSSFESNNVFQDVVDTVQYLMPHVNGATLQVLEDRDRLTTRAWSRNIQPEALTSPIWEGVAGLAVSERKMVNVSDVNSDPNFVNSPEKADFQSLLVMPLFVREKVVGVISVGAPTPKAFGTEEECKIQLLAKYAAVALENTRLYTEHALAEETLKNYTEHLQEIVESHTLELRTAQDKFIAQKGLEQEIDLARQVQASLLAQEIPQLDGYVFAATAIPARYVGGDFYDFVPKNNICYVILADISGKGIPAAMLTSTARTLVRAAMKYESEPALILSDMQDAIYPDLSRAEMFGTFFAASLDPQTATLSYANAGHTQAIWWQHNKQAIERLEATGLPIGIIPDNEIFQKQILLSSGDTLVFYSDGITETFNSKEEMFGLERLMELITANGDDSAHTLAQRILTEVDSFANGAPLVDDLTLVVLKVLPRIVSFKYEIDLERFDDVVHFIRRKIDAYGVDFAYQVELAASEVITNIVKYAYQGRAGELRGEITLQENDVILDLYDDGNRFDPSKLTEIDLEQAHIGGYGMHIVHQIMDKVDYSPGGEKGSNHWRMVKRLTGDKKP
jgi:serine phosphatase RsbU (regulator of sigma subunit)/anti-sigma regulatory factor (Ser/Thr protein kinase)/putative methionine-R-sulfoxide reductase with GAF domain